MNGKYLATIFLFVFFFYAQKSFKISQKNAARLFLFILINLLFQRNKNNFFFFILSNNLLLSVFMLILKTAHLALINCK